MSKSFAAFFALLHKFSYSVKSMLITFWIIDGEMNIGDEYEYEGYFVNMKEVKQFMRENVLAGNGIMILEVEEITVEEYEKAW